MILITTFQFNSLLFPKYPDWFEGDGQNTRTASPLVFLWLWKQHRLQTGRALTRHSELIATSIFLEFWIGFSTLAKERSQQTTLLPVSGLSRHKQQGSLWTRAVTTCFPVRLPFWWCLSNCNRTVKINLNFLL